MRSCGGGISISKTNCARRKLSSTFKKSGFPAGGWQSGSGGIRQLLIVAAESLGEKVGTRQACAALSVPRATFYRRRRRRLSPPPVAVQRHGVRGLSEAERAVVTE